MTKSRFTAEERRDLALQYLSLPWGQRGRWLVEQSITESAMRSWRKEVARRVFAEGMIPRGGVMVPAEENREMGRLHQENQRLRAELDSLRRRDEAKDRVIDALGKAIELLQDAPAGKGSTGRGRP